MSIFKKASELEQIPKFINKGVFGEKESALDEFDSLIKEAQANKSIYENRLKEFNKSQSQIYNFEKPEPLKYYSSEGGIRRIGYGEVFADEKPNKEQIRQFDNNKYANLSIWNPEFDEITEALNESQIQHDAMFDQRTAREKKAAQHNQWELNQMNSIRKSKILPYRGLNINRLPDEKPLNHGKFNSKNEFYGEAQDEIINMIRNSNKERKGSIQRKGYDPEEKKSQWENKAAIEARTMASQCNSSFLMKFAEELALDDQ